MNEQMKRLYAAALETRGITSQAELARALNTSSQTINNWEARGISKQGLLTAQRVLGISASWLETGRGLKLQRSDTNVSAAPIGKNTIPLINYVQAGNWMGAVNPFQPQDAHEFLMTDLELSENAFALEIKGDSMLPEFREGDRVIIDPSIQPQPGDFVVAKNGEDEATFKKYRPRGINERGELIFELVPLNEDYPSMRSDMIPIRIVGTMVEHRKYRKR